MPFRIAILEADTPLPEVEREFGRYGDIFANFLLESAATLDPPLGPNDLHFTKWDVVNSNAYPELDSVDCILITGSKHCAYDTAQWITNLKDFTRRVLMEQDRVRVIGVCFGHQIVGSALGGVLDSNENGWEISITKVDLNDIGKQVFGLDSFNVHQMHRDHLVTLPVNPFPQLPDATLEIIGETEACAVQGLYTPRKVITVQGHPEFNEKIIQYVCAARHKMGIFTDAMVKDALSRATLRNDGPIKNGIGSTFLKFALEGYPGAPNVS